MKDMRDFVARGEEVGLCKRITAEVDWNLELSHIAKLNEEESGPALLFENVKIMIRRSSPASAPPLSGWP